MNIMVGQPMSDVAHTTTQGFSWGSQKIKLDSFNLASFYHRIELNPGDQGGLQPMHYRHCVV